MAVKIIQMFNPTALTTVAATLYTVGGPASTVLKRARIGLNNVTNVAVSASVWFVPSGGTSGVANNVVNAVSVAPNTPALQIDLPDMASGAFIQALSSVASGISIEALDGLEFS